MKRIVMMASLAFALLSPLSAFSQGFGGGGFGGGGGGLGLPRSGTYLPYDIESVIDEERMNILIDKLILQDYEDYLNTLPEGEEEPPSSQEWKDMGFVGRQYHRARGTLSQAKDIVCITGRWRPEQVQITLGASFGVTGTATFVFDVDRLCAD